MKYVDSSKKFGENNIKKLEIVLEKPNGKLEENLKKPKRFRETYSK